MISLAIITGLHRAFERSRIRSLTLQAYAGNANATESLKAAGSNALPVLLQLARFTNSPMQKNLLRHRTELPGIVLQIPGLRSAPPRDVEVRAAVARTLGSLENEAKGVVPVLVNMLEEQGGNVR